MGNVVVIGALSYDCVAVVPEFPGLGQTMAVPEAVFRLGGQGGLHAVAAARQGATVAMLGCVGDDSAGDAYCEFLEHRSIDAGGVITREGSATGTAMIWQRERDGAHQTVAAACANATLHPSELEAQRVRIAKSRMMLAHMDVPHEFLAEALEMGRLLGSAVGLHVRPWVEGFPFGRMDLDFVIAGPEETKPLLGRYVYSLQDADWVGPLLQEKRIEHLILHRDLVEVQVFRAHGAPLVVRVSPPETLVDPMGAAEGFAGAFAARWAAGRETVPSLRAALLAARETTQTAGTLEAFPDREAMNPLRPRAFGGKGAEGMKKGIPSSS